jgi:hypothetical protein
MVTDIAELHPLRRICGPPRDLTEEERTSKGKLDTQIRMYNRAVPGLRLQIPDYDVSLNLEVCADYYFRCQHACLEEDAASKVAELLTSFLEQHQLEWHLSYWKNDLIAKLVLDRFDKSCVGLVYIGRGARTLTRASVPAYHAGVRNVEVHLPMRKSPTPARLLRLSTLQILLTRRVI